MKNMSRTFAYFWASPSMYGASFSTAWTALGRRRSSSFRRFASSTPSVPRSRPMRIARR